MQTIFDHRLLEVIEVPSRRVVIVRRKPADQDADPELVMPQLALALLPGWLAGIMIAGATAAMMSTADSQLLVASSTLVEDLYVRLFRPNAKPESLVLISRICTIVIAGIAFSLAWSALTTALGSPNLEYISAVNRLAPLLHWLVWSSVSARQLIRKNFCSD